MTPTRRRRNKHSARRTLLGHKPNAAFALVGLVNASGDTTRRVTHDAVAAKRVALVRKFGRVPHTTFEVTSSEALDVGLVQAVALVSRVASPELAAKLKPFLAS